MRDSIIAKVMFWVRVRRGLLNIKVGVVLRLDLGLGLEVYLGQAMVKGLGSGMRLGLLLVRVILVLEFLQR